jgi:predicted enzyme related to lactoylglutathione lyase
MADNAPKHGTFCWNELITRDTTAAGKFYSELLGWQAVDSGMPGMDYKMFKVDETNAGGLMAMPPEMPKDVPPHWMAYITVDDIDAAADKVNKLGGKVLFGPQAVPTLGRFATIQDPTGAVVSLIQFSS